MAVLSVNPTRMELTNLKRKLTTARRGHKLLKDKRDELMRRFLDLVRRSRVLREEVEEAIKNANAHMAVARSVMSDDALEAALLLPSQKMTIELETQNIMSVEMPVFKGEFSGAPEADLPYGFAFTSAELDSAVHEMSSLLPKMLELAQLEKSCHLLAGEIEKTRRRVNALEHVMIPQYEETIKYIQMKLDENDRSTTTRLMKVKDMMIAAALNPQQ
ncbi:MAG: V-type ATP synthase subunit D [Clostridia bacterium]|nr:V-type ATP synthase subunit D [Clostridia bacterium]